MRGDEGGGIRVEVCIVIHDMRKYLERVLDAMRVGCSRGCINEWDRPRKEEEKKINGGSWKHTHVHGNEAQARPAGFVHCDDVTWPPIHTPHPLICSGISLPHVRAVYYATCMNIPPPSLFLIKYLYPFSIVYT